MRTIFLAAALVIASASVAPAQTMPNLTYPEAGTFCGFLKPCEVDKTKTPLAK